MSEVGFYRYKTLADSKRTIYFNVNGINVASKQIIPISFCLGGKILKYLDKNGQYRFYPFNKFFEVTDSPQQIGKVNKFITNILLNQSNSSNIGYNNERELQISAEVPSNELLKLTDLFTSPKVFLYIGSNNSDSAKDWLEVQITVSNAIVRRRKANSGQVDITVSLPENYNIKLI